MPIRYMLKHLFMPPGVLLLLLVLAWWLRRRAPRLAACCFVVGLGGLWGLSMPVTVQTLGRYMENEPVLAATVWPQLAEQAEVIVVLGGGRERDDPAWGGDQPSALALERIRYAARLAKASGLPLLTSGGLHYGQPPSEADLAAEVLATDFGLATRWREATSRTTWENAVNSAALLREVGIHRVVLVTQAWHMPRARWCFEQAGLTVVPAPVGRLGVANARPAGGWLPEGRALWQNTLLLNELAGNALYPWLYGAD